MPVSKLNLTYQPGLFDEEADDASERSISPEEARRISDNARNAFDKRVREMLIIPDAERAEKGINVPTYYEDFLALVDEGWPWRVAAYIAWAASPRAGRWPATQDELAREVLGMTSDRQISKWRKNNPAIADLISDLQVAPMLQHRADVVAALISSATTPDYKNHPDRKLLLEITGDYVPSSKLIAEIGKSADNVLANKSDGELLRQAGEEAPASGPDPARPPCPAGIPPNTQRDILRERGEVADLGGEEDAESDD
jgi:hypothetical protein